MSEIDWAAIAEAVVRDLLGDPNPRLSRGRQWRYGRHGSLSVDLEKGVWHDFETDEGGGVLHLNRREQHRDTAEAFRWLRDRGHVPEQARLPSGARSHRTKRKPRSATPSSPRTRSGDAETWSTRLVQPIWSASIPADGTPGHAYLADRMAWPAWEYAALAPLSADVRWISRARALRRDLAGNWAGLPDGVAGALLTVLRAPTTGEVRGISLEGHDAVGLRPAERWRRTFGRARGSVFEARASDPQKVVHISEGAVDALALVWASWLEPRGGRIVSIGGTSGFRGLRAKDVPQLVGAVTTVVLHPDGDPQGQGELAAIQAQAHIQAAGRTCRIRRCAPGLDPAEEVAAWLHEQAGALEQDGYRHREAAVRDAWVNTIQSSRRRCHGREA